MMVSQCVYYLCLHILNLKVIVNIQSTFCICPTLASPNRALCMISRISTYGSICTRVQYAQC